VWKPSVMPLFPVKRHMGRSRLTRNAASLEVFQLSKAGGAKLGDALQEARSQGTEPLLEPVNRRERGMEGKVLLEGTGVTPDLYIEAEPRCSPAGSTLKWTPQLGYWLDKQPPGRSFVGRWIAV